MTAATITLPAPAGSVVDDDLIHQVCCDEDIALCGASVPNHEYEWCDDDDPLTCPLCAHLEYEGLPCTIPGCEYAS